MPRTQLAALIVVAICLVHVVLAGPNYLDAERQKEDSVDEYGDNLERLLENTRKRAYFDSLRGDRRDDNPIKIYRYGRRSCVSRGQRCDHRPSDCCYNSSCRCNLWGTNCSCERMGLFQQWGK